MQTMSRIDTIIEYCLMPLKLDPQAEATLEACRRLEHVLKTYRAKLAHPVAVDFSKIGLIVINEAAHGYE